MTRRLQEPLPTGRGLGYPTPQRAALLTAADRALLLPELRLLRGGECSSLANPPGTSGRREPAAPTRTCTGTASTRTAHTGNTATQAINILPWAQWGGLTLLKAEGGKPTTMERRRPDEGLLRGYASDRSLGPRGSGGNARPRILSALRAGTLESFRMLSLNGSTKKHSNVSKELWQPQCQGHC